MIAKEIMSTKVKAYDGLKIKNYSVTYNPEGKDYYLVPKTQYGNGFATTVYAQNGDYRTSAWLIKTVAFDGTNMMIVFDRPVNFAIRINYVVIEQL